MKTKSKRIVVMVTGQGGFEYFEGPFYVPEDVYEEGEAVEYLREGEELELGCMESTEVMTADDLKHLITGAQEALGKMGAKADEEGLCPKCGGELKMDCYHGEIIDGEEEVEWECPKCQATGKQYRVLTFDRHEVNEEEKKS